MKSEGEGERIAELEAEVAALKARLAAVEAHPWWPWWLQPPAAPAPVYPWQPQYPYKVTWSNPVAGASSPAMPLQGYGSTH